jgi:hypothetical protein
MVVLRVTHDPAPRIMNCFVEDEERGTISIKPLLDRMSGDDGDEADVKPYEVVIGGIPIDHPIRDALNSADNVGKTATIKRNVTAAFDHLLGQLSEKDGHVILSQAPSRDRKIKK